MRRERCFVCWTCSVVFPLSLVRQGRGKVRQGGQSCIHSYDHKVFTPQLITSLLGNTWVLPSPSPSSFSSLICLLYVMLRRPTLLPPVGQRSPYFLLQKQLRTPICTLLYKKATFNHRQPSGFTTSVHRTSNPQNFKTTHLLFNFNPIRQLATMTTSSASDRDVLPDNVKPVNYDISLFDIELGGSFSYEGTVAIQLKVTKSSKEVSLDCHHLKIHGAELSVDHTKTTQSFKATKITYDAPRQRATLVFPEELSVSEKATLVIRFQGIMNSDMAGFYRS